jgi:hypothetical protein
MEPLSEAEEKVRKDWRWALGLFYLGHVVVIVASYFYVLYLGDSESANNILMEGIGALIVMAIGVAISNYFAYMKSGTKWIGFYLIISPIRTAVDTIKDGVEVYSIPNLTIFEIGYYLTFHVARRCVTVGRPLHGHFGVGVSRTETIWRLNEDKLFRRGYKGGFFKSLNFKSVRVNIRFLEKA